MILDAAEKRLREGGPDAIRLQDIARDVGIAHPTILHHFETRDGLTLALQQRAMQRLEQDLFDVLQPSKRSLRKDSTVWSKATPMCVAPSFRTMARRERPSPRVAPISMPSGVVAPGAP